MTRLLRALSLVLALALPTITVAAEPPAILLAEVYRNQVDVAQYLVSEKLDGVRAIWDGETLRFRSGKEDQRAALVCRWPAEDVRSMANCGSRAARSTASRVSFARTFQMTMNGARCAT